MASISQALGLGDEVRELKIGKSFLLGRSSVTTTTGSSSLSDNNQSSRHNNNNGSHSRSHQQSSRSQQQQTSLSTTTFTSDAFHTIRYDFKPVSVDTSQPATIDFEQSNGAVTVTAPNVEGSGQTETVFSGKTIPYLKECVLIIDHETGEITLERLSQNIIVKNKRVEGSGSSKAIGGGGALLDVNGGGSRKSSPNVQSNGNRDASSSKQPNSVGSSSSSSSKSPKTTLSPPDSTAHPSTAHHLIRSQGNKATPTPSPLSLPNTSCRLSESSSSDSDDERGTAKEDDVRVPNPATGNVPPVTINGYSIQSPEVMTSSDSSESDDSSDSSSSSEDDDEEKMDHDGSNPPNNVSQTSDDVKEMSSDYDSSDDEERGSTPLTPNPSNAHLIDTTARQPSSNQPSMANISQLNEDLCLSESGSDSD